MLKQLTLTFLITASTLTYAQTCPSVADIQSEHLNGWRALSIDSASPASESQLQQFKSQVAQFKLAEWMKDAPEGASHCYYSQTDHKNFLQLYLAKDHLSPNSAAWVHKTVDNYQCSVNAEACSFIVSK